MLRLDRFNVFSPNMKAKLNNLISADPTLLHQRIADGRRHESEGNLDLGPSVTTCDGQLKTSAITQCGLARIGNPNKDALDGSLLVQ